METSIPVVPGVNGCRAGVIMPDGTIVILAGEPRPYALTVHFGKPQT
jgi:hypothetical protein